MIARMSHRLSRLGAALAIVCGAAALLAQSPVRPAGQAPSSVSPQDRWLRAVDAWEAGAYPTAIADLQALMKSPAAPEYLDRVALLTGELYTTTELTTQL